MKLSSVTLPISFGVAGEQHTKWLVEQHGCAIEIEGDFVWIQKGSSRAFSHVSQILHATELEPVEKAKVKA